MMRRLMLAGQSIYFIRTTAQHFGLRERSRAVEAMEQQVSAA